MKVQACQFQMRADGDWLDGVCGVKEFGFSDITWIVDKNGQLIGDIYNYRLCNGALQHIDTDYRG